jgi:hypothetical protein
VAHDVRVPAPLLTAARVRPVSGWRLRLLASIGGVAMLLAAYGGWVFGALDGVAMGLLIAAVLAVWLQPSVGAALAWAYAVLFAVHHTAHDVWWVGAAVEYALLVSAVAWHSGLWVRRLDRAVAVDAVIEEPPSPARRVPFLVPWLLASAVVLGGGAVAAGVLGWSFAAALLAGVAVAAGARAILTDRWRRQLFTRSHPAFEVKARLAGDRATIYASDAEPDDDAFLTLVFRGSSWADGPEQTLTLIGLPAPGAWCTLRVDGELLLPAGEAMIPARAPRTEPADTTA